MATFYHKLWALMDQKDVTYNDLSRELSISTATLTKLRKNQSVSLETLDRIREYLECDFGDILTAVPENASDEVNWQRKEVAGEANNVYRMALVRYMQAEKLSVQEVAKLTTLALNTVKEFLKGKELSVRSLLKLSALGKDFNDHIGALLSKHNMKALVYCNQRCGRRRECFGLRREFHPDTHQYMPYCYLGFTITPDPNDNLVAAEGCPHPKNTRELEYAIRQYGEHFRGEVEYIPARDELGEC